MVLQIPAARVLIPRILILAGLMLCGSVLKAAILVTDGNYGYPVRALIHSERGLQSDRHRLLCRQRISGLQQRRDRPPGTPSGSR